MKGLLIYLKEYKKESVLGPLFKLLEASFELLVPLVMAAIIDTGIANGDGTYVWRMGAVLLGLGLVGLVCSITAQYFAAKAAVGCSSALRRALFARLQSLSYSQLDQVGAPTLITRMTSDVNQVQSGINLALRLLLRSPFIVFGAMLMAFTIDGKAALIFVVTLPVLALVVFGIMLWSIPRYGRIQGALDRVLGLTRENLTGVRVVRAFDLQQQENRRFQEENSELTQLQVVTGRISALMNPLTYVLVNLAIVGLIRVGGLQVEAGILTQGQVVALVNYMSQILVELIKLANLIITITKALACARRIQSVLDLAPQEAEYGIAPGGAQQQTPRVAFEQVGMAYQRAGGESLSDVTFAAWPGETIGIIGGTGAGKTTLVNLIPGFYSASRGRVLVDGVDVRQYDPSALRSRIGVAPQRASLFRGTIRENLLWGRPNATDQELWQALETAQAREFVQQKEGGLDAPVEQGGKNLSGGQRQRLTIARALVRRPDILILDDSASALDYATDFKLRQALRTLKGTTVFLVSQRAASLLQADRIIVLEEGRVAGMGTHQELLAGCPEYQEIYYSQFPREAAR